MGQILGLPFLEAQGKWTAQLLSGKKTLPSCQEMMKSIEEFYHSKEIAGIPKHKTHEVKGFEVSLFGDWYLLKHVKVIVIINITIQRVLQNCDEYGENIGLPNVEEWKIELRISTAINRSINLETFRDSWDDDDKVQEAKYLLYST